MAVTAWGFSDLSVAPSTVFVSGGRFGFVAGAPDAAWGTCDAEVRPLRFGCTPVTNAAYAPFLATGRAAEPPWWRDPEFDDPEQPVVGVTWFEATAYCEWLRESVGGRWRLPTEAEWEHAAASLMATTKGAAPPVPPRLLRVAATSANAYGMADVGTSVREWCLDWFAAGMPQLSRRYDPRGPETGEKRIRRGGSWRSPSRPPWTGRDGLEPQARAADGGFRVVREVP